MDEIELPVDENVAESAGGDEVDRMLMLAKVQVNDTHPLTQRLMFDSPLLSHDCSLIELDQHCVQHIQNGGTLTLRGDVDDEPVLCTNDRSFVLKEAEMSNALLLMPECASFEGIGSGDGRRKVVQRKVSAMHTRYYELRARKCVPVTRLKELLQEVPFAGPAHEMENPKTGFTTAELLEHIQMSENELQSALKSLPTCLVNGAHRWLQFDYRAHFLSDVVDALDDTPPLDIHNFDVDKMFARLGDHDYPVDVAWSLLRLFAKPANQQETHYGICERSVCRLLAEVLLRPTKRFHFDDFMKLWNECAPSGVTPKLEYLQGLALIQQEPRAKTVEYFPASELPESAEKRFPFLFARRARWLYDDLVAYLSDLAPTTKEVSVLVTKFCRSTTIDGVRWYNAR